MTQPTLAVLLTLVVYKLALISIGLWANRRTKDSADFFLGGRSLGPWVAALSASASSSSAWSLLGVSGAAYLWGLSAFWLFPPVILGFIFNWLWLAPRIRRLARAESAITLTDVLVGPSNPLARPTAALCSVIIGFSLAFYVAAQFQAAGDTFAGTFGTGADTSILIGGAIILVYTLLGGFWAVSVTDTLQGLLMAAAAVVLPVAALIAVGGPGGLIAAMQAQASAAQLSWTGPHVGLAAVGFVIGLLGIGLGNPGQPHVVNRFMALHDERAVARGRVIAISWATIVFGGMLIVGWCGRILIPALQSHEQIIFAATNTLFPPIVAGVLVAAVLSAIMSTADSQLLVASSAISHDIRVDRDHQRSIVIARGSVLAMCAASLLLALYAPEAIFTRVLFAWSALGAAFAPLLIVRLMNYRIHPWAIIAALAMGFGLTVYFNWQPDPPPGRYLERIVPFAIALAIAWLGRRPDPAKPAAPQTSSETA